MHCTKCGKENKEGSRFCGSCGAEMSGASTSADSEVKVNSETPTHKRVQLFTLLEEEGMHEDDSIYPAFGDSWEPKLGKDEKIILTSGAKSLEQHALRDKTWVVDWKLEFTDVYITNKRIIFVCEKYNKGSMWRGSGYGALVAVALTVGSAMYAAHKRKGKAVVGQLRYEWPAAIIQEYSKFLGMETRYLTFALLDKTGTYRIQWEPSFPKSEEDEIVKTVLTSIARYRLDNGGKYITDEYRESLGKYLKSIQGETKNNGNDSRTKYLMYGGLKIPYLY